MKLYKIASKMLPDKMTTVFSNSKDAAVTSSCKSRRIVSLLRGNLSGMKSSCGLFRCGHCSQVDFRVSVIARRSQDPCGVFGRRLYFDLLNLIDRTTLECKVAHAPRKPIVVKGIALDAVRRERQPLLIVFHV